ncbi:MAG: copper homeostasis protein CutC [Fimbriimonadaceae bacterium]
MGRTLIEVCVDGVDRAVAAASEGADRLELNAAMELDGLTPSLGVIREVLDRVAIPVIVTVRPRGGDFVYSALEIEAMVRDIALLSQEGVTGVAFGALRPDGALDSEACARMIGAATAMETVLNRAIDASPDPLAVAEAAVELGFSRLLTSGGAPHAPEGLATLAAMQQRFGDRVGILPAGGIRAANVAELVTATGVREVHGTFREGVAAIRGAL